MLKWLRLFIDKLFARYVSTGLVFLLDVILSFISSFVTIYVIRDIIAIYFAPNLQVQWNSYVLVWLIVTNMSAVLMFYVFRIYRIIIRHSSLSDIFKICLAACCAVILDAVILYLLGKMSTKTLVNLAVYFVITVFLLIAIRVVMIYAYTEFQHRFRTKSKGLMHVLIFGTGEESIALASRLGTSEHYRVTGYLTDVKSDNFMTIKGQTVFTFDSPAEIGKIVDRNNVEAILFARDSDLRRESSRLIPFAAEQNIKVLVVPPIDDYASVTEQNIRNMKIEDLLGRDEIAISMDRIKERFSGKVVMITGASGSIGSELCRQMARIGVKKLVLFDNAETPTHNLRLELEDKYRDLDFVPVIGDVRQAERLDYVFRSWRPQIVFHAAAYKHVPLMEDNPCEAVQVNLVGTRLVADKCVEYGAEMMVMISTDKAVNPTNIMGCTKRLAEIYVQSMDSSRTRFVTTRFGNVLGSNGSVIPRFRSQIESGGPVTVTHPEITRYFMTIPEACRLVMEAATMSEGKNIFVFDMGAPVKIDTLARRMIELAGFEPDRDIKVEYSGLRPGEKLYEEVLSDKENTDPTSHNRIRIARVREYSHDDACGFCDQLEILSRKVLIPEMVQLMKQTVPEFKSNNSRFEEYDK